LCVSIFSIYVEEGLAAGLPEPLKELEQNGELIIAKYTSAKIPLDVGAEVWSKAKPLQISIYPQISVLPRLYKRPIQSVIVRALYNDKELAFLLEWKDLTMDEDVNRQESFRDATAIEFPLKYGEGVRIPFVGMGEKNHFVNVWHWKASWQADIDRGFIDVKDAYPHMFSDKYPIEDKLFLSGWAAGSQLSEPNKITPVENLLAQGFGTLTFLDKKNVQGRGVWSQGKWKVIFKRDFKVSSKNEVQLSKDIGLVPVAFAIWEGSIQQRGPLKSLSSWHFLLFEKAKPSLSYAKSLIWNPPIKGDPKKGKEWVEMLGCSSCHTLPGGDEPNEIGTDLSFIGGIHRPDYLLESVKEPSASVVPHHIYYDNNQIGSKMPYYDPEILPEEGFYDIVEYLRTLK
jgi:hypothetical protein